MLPKSKSGGLSIGLKNIKENNVSNVVVTLIIRIYECSRNIEKVPKGDKAL